jgi:phytoene dehydrogenase-like protein
MTTRRASVIGSGPNGLSAAIVLARTGLDVTVFEGSAHIGGGARSAELTLPGFVHDICSAVHPMGISSPAFEQFGLSQCGLEWVQPPVPLAHPLDDGTAVLLERSLDATAAGLAEDGAAWRRVMGPLVEAWPRLRHDVTAAISPTRVSPPLMRLGWHTLFLPWKGTRARALFAGLAAHSAHPLHLPASRAIGLVLATCAHTVGWPSPRGGSQRIADALAECLRSHGGKIVPGRPVTELPSDPMILCDVTPRQMLSLAGAKFPEHFRRQLAAFRYGPGAFKIDWALDAPIPWRALECLHAGTVHLGGTAEEIAQWETSHTGRPFVLLAQPTLFDPARAPAGKHTAWGYCHVPNGSSADMTRAIEDQIERFAPGFRTRILARSVLPPTALEALNPNLIGGDFNGGALDGLQLWLRPTPSLYRTPLPGVYFCGSSTPPGGGVHGMCGYHAANLALNCAAR